jgi:fatty-acyl-CoA synthase
VRQLRSAPAAAGASPQDSPSPHEGAVSRRLWDLVSGGVRDHSTLYLPRQSEREVRLTELLDRAERTASEILTRLDGHRPRRVGLLLGNGEPWVRALLATLRLDATVVPLPLPIAFAGFDAYAAHLIRIAADAELDAVLVDRSFGPQTADRVAEVLHRTVIDVADPADALPVAWPAGRGSAAAVIQYTSGSTSRPKGVVLTHHNVATSLATMMERTAWTDEDILGLWLPLFHDMGLFSLLGAIVGGGSVCLWRPTDFVRRPMSWLEEFAAARATGLPGPNFCYDYLVHGAERAGVPSGLDLSAWRFAINGAEPVQLRTIEAFDRTFSQYGARPGLLHPAYGMAEATLMVTFPELNRPVRHVHVERDRLGAGDRVRVSSRDQAGPPIPGRAGPSSRAVVSCGRPVPGMALRIASASGAACPDGTVGEIQISGPAVTSGYLRVPADEQPITPDGWLRTGDLAFVLDGEVYVAGRLKDVIIIRGQNYYAEDIEEIVRTTLGVDRRTCVALGWLADGDERAVVLWETRLDPAAAAAVADRIADRVRDQLGLGAIQIAPVEPSTIPHTTSGKVQRAATLRMCRERNLLPSGHLIPGGEPAARTEGATR